MDRTHNVIIVDLDGTLADNQHRQHFLEGEHKDWDGFTAACDDDTLVESVAEVVRAMSNRGYVIDIFSGRSESAREQTIGWLMRNRVPYNALCMRAPADYRPDAEIKLEMLAALTAASHSGASSCPGGLLSGIQCPHARLDPVRGGAEQAASRSV
jgi:hypothetical protein